MIKRLHTIFKLLIQRSTEIQNQPFAISDTPSPLVTTRHENERREHLFSKQPVLTSPEISSNTNEEDEALNWKLFE